MTEAPAISLKAETIFHLGQFPVTNALLLGVTVAGVLSLAAILMRRRLALVPGGMQNVGEFLLEGILGFMDQALGDRRKSEKYLPLVGTIFFFVLCANWFGILPGIGSFVVREGAEHVPLLRSPGSDLNFTLALAVIAVLAINMLGIAAIGVVRHAKKFFNFRGPVMFFVGILELVSEIARMVSFSFRLFGNVLAGEVLLTIIAFLVPYVAPVPFLMLEVFVGFIQAFIFGMLSLVFIAMATTEHETSH